MYLRMAAVFFDNSEEMKCPIPGGRTQNIGRSAASVPITRARQMSNADRQNTKPGSDRITVISTYGNGLTTLLLVEKYR